MAFWHCVNVHNLQYIQLAVNYSPINLIKYKFTLDFVQFIGDYVRKLFMPNLNRGIFN